MRKFTKTMLGVACALSTFAFGACDLLENIGGVTSDPYGKGSIFDGNYVATTYERAAEIVTKAEKEGNGDILGNCMKKGGMSIDLDVNVEIFTIKGYIHVTQSGDKQLTDGKLEGGTAEDISYIDVYYDGAYTYTKTTSKDEEGKEVVEKEKKASESLFGDTSAEPITPSEMFTEFPMENAEGVTVSFQIDETNGEYIKIKYDCTMIETVTEEEGEVSGVATSENGEEAKTVTNTISVCLVYDEAYNLVAMHVSQIAGDGGHLVVTVQPWSGVITPLSELDTYVDKNASDATTGE